MTDVPHNQKPYGDAYYAPRPSGFTKFMRRCVLWQVIQFIRLNIIIIRTVSKGHD